MKGALAGDDDPPRIRAGVAETRFGYRQGLEEWPENTRARQGLADLQRMMIRYEIHRENTDAARTLLNALGGDSDLSAAMDALEVRLKVRARAARELAGLGWWNRVHSVNWIAMITGVSVFALVAFAGSALTVWQPSNLFGRRHAGVMACIAAAVWAHWVLGWWLGMSIHSTLCTGAVLSGWILLATGIVEDSYVVPSGLCCLLGLPFMVAFPETVFEIFGVANGLSFFAYAALSGRTRLLGCT